MRTCAINWMMKKKIISNCVTASSCCRCHCCAASNVSNRFELIAGVGYLAFLFVFLLFFCYFLLQLLSTEHFVCLYNRFPSSIRRSTNSCDRSIGMEVLLITIHGLYHCNNNGMDAHFCRIITNTKNSHWLIDSVRLPTKCYQTKRLFRNHINVCTEIIGVFFHEFCY